MPQCIGMPLAEKILFVGKAIELLSRNDESRLRRTRGALLDRAKANAVVESDEQPEAADPLSQPINAVVQSLHQGFASLHQADAIDRCWGTLRQVVERSSAIVAERLWHLMVVKLDLPAHLRVWPRESTLARGVATARLLTLGANSYTRKAVRGFLLLGEGALYQCFLEDAEELITKPPSPKTAERGMEPVNGRSNIDLVGQSMFLTDVHAEINELFRISMSKSMAEQLYEGNVINSVAQRVRLTLKASERQGISLRFMLSLCSR